MRFPNTHSPKEGNRYGLPRVYHSQRRTQEGTALGPRGTRCDQGTCEAGTGRGCHCPQHRLRPIHHPLRAEAWYTGSEKQQGQGPGYSPKLAEAVYKVNRMVCRKPLKVASCKKFIPWAVKQIREHKWSLDACCGYAKLPQNERHNGLFRAFVPKGASIEQYADEDILTAADELNGRPRRKPGYRTPEELFEAFLDSVYAASLTDAACGPSVTKSHCGEPTTSGCSI